MNLVNYIPLSSAVEVYLEWKISYAPTAHKCYQSSLRTFTKYIGEDKDIRQITIDQLQSYIPYLRNSVTVLGKSYSTSTLQFNFNILKNFFNFWKTKGVTEIDPSDIKKMRLPKAYREHVTQEEVEQILAICDEGVYDGLLAKLIVHMLWDTGMRVSELTNIDIKDISSQQGEKMSAKIRTKKTMQYNLVLWGNETARLLDLYLAKRQLISPETDALFIIRKTKDRCSVRYIQRLIQDACQMIRLNKKISPHSFRHGKAHHMLNQGANLRDITAVLRHSKPDSCFHYLSLNETHFRSIAGRYV